MPSRTPNPVIAIDTREQTPWNFPPEFTTERKTLSCGDYSIVGFESKIAIERKSLGDLTGTLTHGRARFIAELNRFHGFDFACVIVEADIGDVWTKKFVSNANPASIVGSCAAFTVDFGIPFLFAGNASNAADFALRLMRRYHKNAIEKVGTNVEVTT